MAKAQTNKNKDIQTVDMSHLPAVQWPDFLQNHRLISLFVGLIAALIYIQSATFGFVMDDAIVITDNMFTQKGVQGLGGILSKDTFYGFFKEAGKETVVEGGRYRPFTLVLFAILHSKTPLVYHLFTILLYACTCVVLYHTVRMCLAEPTKPNAPRTHAIAAITALLFAVHPTHVEAVANIKGCDEIMSLLGSLAALYFTVLAFDKKQMSLAILGGLLFLTGLFSKENAFMFVALIPAALVLFRRTSLATALRFSAPSIAAGVFFFVVRGMVLNWQFGSAPGDLMNNPFLKVVNNHWVPMDAGEKLGTILHTLTLYIKLLFVPHPLTHDYYPKHIDVKSIADPLAILALLIYGALIYQMFKAYKSGKSAIAFGILTFLTTLFVVSNIVFPVGTNMGERFLFMPSFGFLLAFAAFLTDFAIKRNALKPILIGVALVSALFAIKTVMRVPAWKSNDTLFLTDIETSKQSAKLNNAVGGTYYDQAILIKDNEAAQRAKLTKAIPYLNQAIKIHPTYKSAFLLRANCLFYLKQHEDAFKDYKEAIRIDAGYKDAKVNLGICLREAGKQAGEKEGNLPKALKYLEESLQYNPTDGETLRLLGVANGVSGNHQQALNWFIKAVAQDPNNARSLSDLGTAYYNIGDHARAQEYRQKAIAIDPNINAQK